jgi:RimJ/RimL family protein N-acetyltransferase
LSFLESVLGLAEQEHGATRFRATIAAFNARSLLVAERAGFVRTSTFRGNSGLEFVQLIRD